MESKADLAEQTREELMKLYPVMMIRRPEPQRPPSVTHDAPASGRTTTDPASIVSINGYALVGRGADTLIGNGVLFENGLGLLLRRPRAFLRRHV